MSDYQELKGHRDLKVYQLAYKLAMEVFQETRAFPKDERYSLTDQIRRSSRSVAANIAEGFRKRQYPKKFLSKLADADGEATEVQTWLDFARDCEYLAPKRQSELQKGYEEVGRMLGMVMALMGGCWYPLELFPETVRNIVKVPPTTWAMQGMLDLVLRGGGLMEILPEAGALLGFAGVFFVVGVVRFRYE